MAGKRQDCHGTYVTRRRNYRIGIEAADSATDVNLPTIPEVDTRTVAVNPTAPDGNMHGTDARIFLAVLLSSGVTGATVQLWLMADVEEVSPESSSSSSLSPSESWVLVQSNDVTSSALVKVLDIPPGRYKALVTSITGSGSVNLLVQYAG